MEELGTKKKKPSQEKLQEIEKRYGISDDIEKDLAEEVERQRREEQGKEVQQPSDLESVVDATATSSIATKQKQSPEPSALYVTVALVGDACKSVARLPLDYMVGLLPEAAQRKLYGEKQGRAFYTNVIMQPLVTGSAAYFLLPVQKEADRIGWAVIFGLIDGFTTLFRFLKDSGYDRAKWGHPIATIPYHTFLGAKKLTTEIVPNYLSSVYQHKKEEILEKRKEK